jgi:cytochrome c oxidase accessory protein FixG
MDGGAITEHEQVPLFGDRERVYPRRVSGPIRRIKWAVLAFCLTLYYVGPWLRWYRGPGRPDQALLIDMPNRRGYFFAIEIWPQEIYYLTGLLILGALALFLVTSLFGRVWCGFTCPQTVWTDLFMWSERLIEGDRGARMKLDRQPLSWRKAWLKTAKHGVWLMIALATGGAWIMYFKDAPTAFREIFTGQAATTAYFFIALFTATTYLLAGWGREQVCTFMCPWPRIQAAMVDEHSLTVTYRDWRGEPRGKLAKDASWEGRGDCIDCRACVQVCPTGVDIRDGLQLECIGCGLCIDACDDIMRKVGRPTGLIAFDTPASRDPAHREHRFRAHLLRPRTIVYALIFVLASALLVTTLLNRSRISVNVLRDRAPLFVRLSDGAIRNGYTLKIENRNPEAHDFLVSAPDASGATLEVVEPGIDPLPVPAQAGIRLTVKGDSLGSFATFVRAPGQAHPDIPLSIRVRDLQSGETADAETSFRGP